jgi:hypothetical protein
MGYSTPTVNREMGLSPRILVAPLAQFCHIRPSGDCALGNKSLSKEIEKGEVWAMCEVGAASMLRRLRRALNHLTEKQKRAEAERLEATQPANASSEETKPLVPLASLKKLFSRSALCLASAHILQGLMML